MTEKSEHEVTKDKGEGHGKLAYRLLLIPDLHHVQPKDFIFAAAPLAARGEEGADHEHTYRDSSSQMREDGKHACSVDGRGWE